MILIADSGSTKTDWRLTEGNKTIQQISTIGFNPYFQNTPFIAKELEEKLLPPVNRSETLHNKIEKVYFYGAGCSNDGKRQIVKNALLYVFPQASIIVEHDLLAAARALCGSDKGIAAILGTGSNSGFYDGNKIAENIPSLGFMLGDEGSGAYIGKHFLRDYLNNDLPASISKTFYETYKLSHEEILNAIYSDPMPSRYLASFSKFIKENKDQKYFTDLIEYNFEQFFDKQICKYSNYREMQINCVGSVAYHYSEILKEVAAKKDISINKIIESPIDHLVNYHLKLHSSSSD
jgi:glucosamine kinase